MNILKNRTVVGLICIVLSLIISFGLVPLFNGALKSQTEIVRITKDVKKGVKITSSEIETIKVGGFNLPSNVIKKPENIVGKYANADLQKGDYVLNTKVSDSPSAESEYLSNLNGTKQAMSVTIKSFAAGLSGKLEAGDIISILSADFGQFRTTVMPPELQYVEVLAVTSSSGTDKGYNLDTQNQDNGTNQPSTITLLVTPAQAKILVDLEENGKIHTTLIYRGSKENAQKFLKLEDDFLQKQSTGNEAN